MILHFTSCPVLRQITLNLALKIILHPMTHQKNVRKKILMFLNYKNGKEKNGRIISIFSAIK